MVTEIFEVFRRWFIFSSCSCNLIRILKHLIESEEDCVYVACHNGLNPLGEVRKTFNLRIIFFRVVMSRLRSFEYLKSVSAFRMHLICLRSFFLSMNRHFQHYIWCRMKLPLVTWPVTLLKCLLFCVPFLISATLSAIKYVGWYLVDILIAYFQSFE